MTGTLALYRVAQARRVDAAAIAALGGDGYVLMRRAGAAALRVLRERWPAARRVCVVAGGGNNGGDGYVLARAARAAGLEAMVLALVPLASLRGDARRAADDWLAAGGAIAPWTGSVPADADVLVDALLGIGPDAPVREPCLGAIQAINACARPVLSLDLPSGLHGDSGVALGAAVRAAATVTFIVPKAGLWLGDGPACAGDVHCEPLDVAVQVAPEVAAAPAFALLDDDDIARALPLRARAAHKADFGRLLIVGGCGRMPGAVRLAGEAALRVGAGLVTVATAPGNTAAIVAARPELMCVGVADAAALAPLLAAASVVAVGPGLGTDAWARALFEAALACGKPLVIDADALNLLAVDARRAPAGAVLTPHPGEAARLLGYSGSEVQADRPAALARLVAARGGVVVLKGAGTLIGADGQVPALCAAGNPAMAVPGMGDVLTGAIAGILAQCRDPWLAARAGVLAHARAGDALARPGGRGLLALEVAAELARQVQPRA